jgi:hypothetical protein
MERNITRTLCSALDPRLPARLVAPHALDVGRLARLDVAPDAAQVREKATEIASALLAAGMDEGRAIRIALPAPAGGPNAAACISCPTNDCSGAAPRERPRATIV